MFNSHKDTHHACPKLAATDSQKWFHVYYITKNDHGIELRYGLIYFDNDITTKPNTCYRNCCLKHLHDISGQAMTKVHTIYLSIVFVENLKKYNHTTYPFPTKWRTQINCVMHFKHIYVYLLMISNLNVNTFQTLQ